MSGLLFDCRSGPFLLLDELALFSGGPGREGAKEVLHHGEVLFNAADNGLLNVVGVVDVVPEGYNMLLDFFEIEEELQKDVHFDWVLFVDHFLELVVG